MREELEQFVMSRSDFAFEMAALQALQGQGYACLHSATFTDPITDKIRQFDIRARRKVGACGVRLVVECKDLAPDLPMIAYRTPRGPSESSHAAVYRRVSRSVVFTTGRTACPSSLYPVSEPVARKIEQPSRRRDGSIGSSDASTFEKWSQALHGVHDELQKIAIEGFGADEHVFVIPTLVVPDGALWCISYDSSGSVVESLSEREQCELYVGHSWRVVTGLTEIVFPVSHIQIVTISRLPKWAASIIEPAFLENAVKGIPL